MGGFGEVFEPLIKREEVLAEIGLTEYKYLALGEIWRIFGLKQSKYASKRQADQFILYRGVTH